MGRSTPPKVDARPNFAARQTLDDIIFHDQSKTEILHPYPPPPRQGPGCQGPGHQGVFGSSTPPLHPCSAQSERENDFIQSKVLDDFPWVVICPELRTDWTSVPPAGTADAEESG